MNNISMYNVIGQKGYTSEMGIDWSVVTALTIPVLAHGLARQEGPR